MNTHTIKTTKRQIAKWWYSYGMRVTRSGKFDRLPLFVQRLIVDMGEPNCWGCDRQLGCDIGEWEGYRGTWESMLDNYNRLPVERAHIIPVARGGSDAPNNLLLLCRGCHQDSPDTTNPHYMFGWLNNRPKALFKKRVNELYEACESIGILPRAYVNMKTILMLMPEENEKWLEHSCKMSVAHFDVYALASEAATMLDYFKKYHPDQIEEILSGDKPSIYRMAMELDS